MGDKNAVVDAAIAAATHAYPALEAEILLPSKCVVTITGIPQDLTDEDFAQLMATFVPALVQIRAAAAAARPRSRIFIPS